jgi:hypothetical protein
MAKTGEALKTRIGRLLKRKGRDAEESLLFDDKVDESFLDHWESEGKPGPGAKHAHRSAAVEPSQTPTEDILVLAEEAAPAPEEPPSQEEADLNSRSRLDRGKLRWLGLQAAISLWEDRSPFGRIAAVVVCLVICVCLAGAGIPIFRATSSREVPSFKPFPKNERALVANGLFLPIQGGERGLYLSLAVEVGKGFPSELTSALLRGVRGSAYDAVRDIQVKELRGYQGIKALKGRILELLQQRHPDLQVEGIFFVDYAIL